MRYIVKKSLSALLALLLTFSVLSTSFSAENLADKSGESKVAAVGAATPVITSIEPCQEGVKVTWDKMNGVSYYRVYRWFDDGRGWVVLTDTKQLFYVDTNVSSGNTYRYRLAGINAAGDVITGTATKSFEYYAPARITNVESISDGIRVTWEKEKGVRKVALYRMTDNGWKRIATTSDSSYVDKEVSYNTEYRYTVRTLTDSGDFLYDFYDEIGVTIRRVTTPVLRAENAAGGVKISWNAVEGAEGYRVFYRNSKGGWSRLGDTTSTSLLDDDVSSNYTYTYTVRCISADGEYYTSYFDTAGKAVAYIAAPVLLSASGTDNGISISWKASAGAAKYRVFYRNSSGDWTRVADTAATSYLDKNVTSGTVYTYTVRCLNAAGDYISSFYSAGISGVFLSAPVFTVENGPEGVDISWNAVKGAVNYRVYYYGSKGWTKLTDTTETSFTDTDVTSNHTYTYTVRCINAEGNQFTSGYLAGKSVKYIAAPKITKLSNAVDGVRITWNAVDGAQKYRVYYYGSKGWTKMVDTTSTTYLDKDVASGKNYTYTVRCINSAASAFTSSYKPGVSLRYIAAPDFSVTLNEKSVTVDWNAVEGAELYRVYLRSANDWVKLIDTTSTSFEYKNILSGTEYNFTVRCLNASATAATSDFRAGKGVRYVETPHISSVTNTPEGVGIIWNPVQGAVKYRLYYKGSKGWTKLTDTTDTSFVDTDVASGCTYTYTLRCINAAGDAFESSYDKDGSSVHYIAAPKNLKAQSEKNSVKITWAASGGAQKYRVYYKSQNGWTKFAETTATSAVHTDVVSGSTYTYTVRCISADGKSFTSDFDHNGVTYKYTQVPTLQSADVNADGIKISWNASKGAEKYRVYYYGSKGWTKLAETTSTSVVDSDVSSGYTYRYTVRCITADGKSFTSDYDATGLSFYYCSTPKLQNLETDSQSVTVTWTKPAGAAKYRVYKKVNGSWQKLADTTSNSYTDKNVSVGNTYIYTVRVINSAGNQFCSYYDTVGFIVTVVSGIKDFYYYDQTQYTYPYGDDTIANSGCGPTCFAMIASTLTGKTITPIDAVSWCGNSYYVRNVGTMWSYFGAASKRFGITMESQTYMIDTAIEALKKGKYVISSQSYGRFTKGGHFIVLAGVNSSGKIIVYDPNGANRYVGTAFTKAEISEAGTCYWIFDR